MSKEKVCTVYVAPEDNPLTQQEIMAGLAGPKMEDRIKALKSLVIQTINDEAFPRMIMQVINTLVPIQSESHLLKKILLFYWEVIEKVSANGQLKEEMILVCNSLRNDLLHPNEYIRGRTLKLLSRIQYKGILEPLQSAIVENIKHKHVYVRRNAVVCMYEIFLNFNDDIISDMDEYMQQLLLTETDLSTRRNAFLLLFHVNQQQAMDYLASTLFAQEDSNEFGDILQISILELFRKVCKVDPSQKSRLMKSIFQFSKSKSPSVQYECSNTLCAVSLSVTSLKIAVGIYMQLFQSQTDNNIKLVVLDRLEHIRALNPRILEDQVLELTTMLGQQSIDIRRKVLQMLQHLVKSDAVQQIVGALTKEIQKIQNETDESANEYRFTLLQTTLQMISSFPECRDAFSSLVADSVLANTKLDDHSAQVASQIVSVLTREGNPRILSSCLKRFYDIQHLQMFKSALFVLGQLINPDDAVRAFNEIKRAIGSFPLELPKSGGPEPEEKKETKPRVKTVILPDGTYGTQTVDESNSKSVDQEQPSKFRELLMSNSFIASSLTRTLMKLLLVVPPTQYNRFAAQTLMILLALVRFFQANLSKVDQETLERLYFAIRVLSSPEDVLLQIHLFVETNKETPYQPLKQEALETHESQDQILKQPDDVVVIRQLKRQGLGTADIDLADEEISEEHVIKEDTSFVSRLNHIVQLTGYSDPIYSEAFVNIHKYDITFEVLFINRSPKMVQNVQVEFRTGGDSKVLEKAQGVTLQPNQTANVRTSIKFSSADIGVIHGAIHYENNAGVEQAYLVTKEINIDLMDFIYPGEIDINSFRKCWAKYEWENRIAINTQFTDVGKFVQHIERKMKMKRVADSQEQQGSTSFVCANLYAKTKFDDDFLINISADSSDGKTNGFIRIRSKVKGVVVNLGDRVKQIQLKDD